MADYETIMKALRNADAAGDTAAATRLAQMAREARQAKPEPAPEAAPAQPERGLRQRLYDNIIGDPDDGVQSTGEALGTWLRRGTESATLGVVGDEVNAAGMSMLPGRTYEGELSRLRADEANMSTAGRLTADFAGALVPGLGAAGAIGKGGNALAKVGRGALAGGVSGGAYGFAEGEGGIEGRRDNALSGLGVGLALGGIASGIGAGARSIARGRAINKAARGAQTGAQLKAAGREAYQAIDDANVQIKPEAFDRLRAGALDRLRNTTGYDELPGAGVTPRTARVMQTMDEAAGRMAEEPSAALPFRSLDQARRRAGSAAQDFTNRADQQAGTTLIKEIDDFVQGLGADDVAGGDVETLKSAIGKARDLWSQARKSELIDNAVDQSGNYLSGGASGVRNQLARILRNKKLSSGFNEAEREVLRRVINGGFFEQIVHMAGGRLGQTATTVLSSGVGGVGGGGIGAMAGAGAGAAIAGGARNLSNALAMRGIEGARGLINSGALRDPKMMNALIGAGQRAEALTTGNALAATSLLARP